MRKKMSGFVVVGVLYLMFAGLPAQGNAGVSVGVNITIPAYTIATPPALVVIPGTYAYFVPDANIDIVFYHGFWYRPYEGRWFRARGYNGPWTYVEIAKVPRVLVELPPDYRHVYREHQRIAYRDFDRNWRGWEKHRYWERDERWRAGRNAQRYEDSRGHEKEERREHHDERGRS